MRFDTMKRERRARAVGSPFHLQQPITGILEKQSDSHRGTGARRGNSLGNRLQRVIRRLPILGAVPQQDRLSPLLAIRYPNHAPLSQNRQNARSAS